MKLKSTLPEAEEQKILDDEMSDFEFCSYQRTLKADPEYVKWLAETAAKDV